MASRNKPTVSTSSTSTPKRKRWLKRIGIGVIALLVVLVFLVLLGPALISSGPGTRLVLSFVNGSIPGKVKIDDLSVGWTKGQRIKGLALAEPGGAEVFTVEEIDAKDVSLWSLLRGGMDFGAVRVVKPVGEPDRVGAVFSSPDKKKEDDDKKKEKEEGPGEPLRVNLEVTDAQLKYAGADQTAIDATIPTLNVKVDTLALIHLKANGQVREGSERSGSFDTDMTVRDLTDSAGNLQPQRIRLEGTADIKTLPTAFVDRVAKQDGFVVGLLGPSLDANVKAAGSLEQLQADVDLQSERLQADLQFANEPESKAVVGKGVNKLRLKVTQETWPALQERFPQLEKATLVQPFEIECDIRKLTLPLIDGKTPDLAQTALECGLRSGAITLDWGEKIGRIELANVDANVASEALGKRIDATVQAAILHANHQGKVDASVGIDDALTAEGGVNDALAATVDAKLTDVPTAFVDQVSGQDGLVMALLGPALNADVKVEKALNQLNADVAVNSQRLQATLKLAQGQNASSGGSGQIRLQVTSETWPTLQQRFPALANANFVRPFQIVCDIRKLTLPMKDGGTNLAGAALDIGLTSDAVALDLGENRKRVELANFNTTVTSSALGEQIDASLKAAVQQGQQRGDVSATAIVKKAFTVDGFNKSCDMKLNSQLANVPSAVLEQFVDQLAGISEQAIGPTVDVTVAVERLPPAPGKEDEAFKARYDANVKAAHLNAKANGEYRGETVLISDANLQAIISPETVRAYVARRQSELSEAWHTLALTQPATVNVSLSQVEAPIGNVEVGKLSGSAKLRIDQFVPQGVAMLDGVAVRNLDVDVPQLALGGETKLTATTELFHRENRIPVRADVTATKAMEKDRGVDATLTVNDLVLALVDQILGQPGQWSGLLGEKVDKLTLTAKKPALAAEPWWALEAVADSATGLEAHLVGRARTDTDPAIFELSDSQVTSPITPAGFAALTKGDDAAAPPAKWKLSRPALLKVTIETVKVALKAPKPVEPVNPAEVKPAQEEPSFMERIDPLNSNAKMTLAVTDLFLQHEGEARVLPVKSFNTEVAAENLTQPINIAMHTSVDDQARGNAAAPTGMFDATVTVRDLYTPQGQYSRDNMAILLDAKANQFPVDLVDQIIQQDDLLTGYLGPTANGEVRGQIYPRQPGALAARVDASYAKLSVDSAVCENRDTVTLNEPVQAHFLKLTQKMVDQSLRSIMPFLGDAVGAEQEIQVHVAKENFSAPIDPFDIAKVSADVQIMLGTLRLKPRGDFAEFMGLFGMKDTELLHADVTPINARLRNGKLDYDRFTMTLAGLPLTFRGSVDLVQKRYNVNMGVPVGSLGKYIKELRSLSEDKAVIEVPITGSYDKYDVDIGKMTTEIAKLGVKAGVRDALGEEGKPIGDLLDSVLGGGGGNQQQPPQRQQNNSTQPRSGTNQQNRQTKPQEEQDPVGGLLEILRQNEEDKKRQEEERQQQ